MTYGTTYSRQPTKEEKSQKNSLISCLCNEAGYNREDLENTELEAKIDLLPKKADITLGESLKLPEPYSRDRILTASKSVHSCYVFIRKDPYYLEPAFTKVERNGKVKIKLKSATEYIEIKGITLLKRCEKHLENLTQLELNKHISEIARKSNLPLEYVGYFSKQSKETFVFNPTTGRIFVIATNICEIESNKNRLSQLEVEYYGQINGFTSLRDVCDDLADLVSGILKNIPWKYSAKNSRLTKLEWLIKNVR